MTTVTNIRALAPALPEVVGYVEAFTTDRVLGWAWAPAGAELHVAVELRLGETVVSEGTANLPRPDLAANGIGDGSHAYDLAIPNEFRTRAAELRVFARAGQGEAVAIGAPPAADGLSDQVLKLQRGVDMLIGSQRLIHRNLQTALTAAKDPGSDPMAALLAKMAELQAATDAQVAGVERFVVRLDEHLSRLAPEDVRAPVAKTTIPVPALWALGISGFALFVSVAGLIRSLS